MPPSLRAPEIDRVRVPRIPKDVPEAELGDLRFRALLPAKDWEKLPAAVRRRFSKRLGAGAIAVYIGRVTSARLSVLGLALANALRIIGAPLPLSAATGVPSIVTVTEDATTGGQIWTRIYGRTRGFPQVIHSVKCFSGPTGLEERVGAGIAMSLSIHVENGALVFRSHDYTLTFGSVRVVLPSSLTPGKLTVTHMPISENAFVFTLDLRHPLFGTLVRQEALFESEML